MRSCTRQSSYAPLALLVGVVLIGCADEVSTPNEPAIAAPNSAQPVTAAAWLSPPGVQAGDEMVLHVRVRVAGGHYLHSTTVSDSVFTPLSIETDSSDALHSAGDWAFPTADARGRLTGTLDFTRTLRASDSAATGKHDVICNLTYQACNDEVCWPPQKLVLKAPFKIHRK
jgi:hypothetical protein